MSHHEKFWEKFGQKIREHQPEAYTGQEWKAMEQLLNNPAGAPPRRRRRFLIMILLAVALGYLAGAWYGFPSTAVPIRAFPIPQLGADAAQSPPAETTIPSHADDAQELPARQHPAIRKVSPRAVPPGSGTPTKQAAARQPVAVQQQQQPEAGEGKREPLPTVLPPGLYEEKAQAAPLPALAPMAALPYLPTLSTMPASRPLPFDAARSQSTASKEQSRWYGGLLLGVNHSSYSSHPFGGLFAGFRLSPRWSVQLEGHLKYVDNISAAYEEATRLESNNGFAFDQVSRGEVSKNFLAVEIPLTARYRLHPKWQLSAGARASFLRENPTGGQDEPDFSASSASYQGRAAGNEPTLRAFNLGLTAGLEWAIRSRWSIDARFTQGLQDLSQDSAFQPGVKHYNSDIQLSLRYEF